jgi:2-iminobutanoate/2-iminopropanoate deaminase
MSADTRSVVSTDQAPAAIGPYSQAIKAGGFVFTSGVIPLDASTGEVVGDDITVQSERVMANLKAVLEAAGSGLQHVVKTTCFLQNLADFAAFNAVYAESFSSAPPARSTVQVAKLPREVLVEVEAVALLAE